MVLPPKSSHITSSLGDLEKVPVQLPLSVNQGPTGQHLLPQVVQGAYPKQLSQLLAPMFSNSVIRQGGEVIGRTRLVLVLVPDSEVLKCGQAGISKTSDFEQSQQNLDTVPLRPEDK